jgi:hypothetical protein
MIDTMDPTSVTLDPIVWPEIWIPKIESHTTIRSQALAWGIHSGLKRMSFA